MAFRTCHTASGVSGWNKTAACSPTAYSVSRARRPAHFAAVDIDRGPLGDRREPRRGIAVRVEAVRGLPRVHEGLLHGFFREVVTPERVVRNRVHEIAVLAVERAHRVRVALAEGVESVHVHRVRPVRRTFRPASVTDGTFAFGQWAQGALPLRCEVVRV